MDKYIKEGRTSYYANKGKYINPYIGGAKFNNFERGWVQALKQSPNQLFRKYMGYSNKL